MKRRLDISRPRPTRGRTEPPVSFALRLMVWFDEQFQRGWEIEELGRVTEDEEACLAKGHELIRQLAEQRHLLDADGHRPACR